MRAGAVRSATVAVMLLACQEIAPAQSAGSPAKQAPGVSADALRELRGEWTRAGAGFACSVKMPQPIPPDQLETLITRTCLHLGPLVIGDDASRVTSALGPPHRTLKQPKGQVAWVYFIGERDHYPYFIVTVAAKKVIALQVTGEVPAPGYAFNRVALGATSAELIAVFGAPTHFEPSDLKDTELWTYPPQPFSFEIKGDRVISIRIREP